MTTHPHDVPVGGTNGSAAVNLAARWLATTPRSQRGPAVPEVRKRFGLGAEEAVAAIREDNLIRARAT